ncbi:hypothetical protein A2U01_0053598, partial [Trifolium medium]|nr:hypothetical protein [Trifolium medium]
TTHWRRQIQHLHVNTSPPHPRITSKSVAAATTTPFSDLSQPPPPHLRSVATATPCHHLHLSSATLRKVQNHHLRQQSNTITGKKNRFTDTVRTTTKPKLSPPSQNRRSNKMPPPLTIPDPVTRENDPDPENAIPN